MKNKNCFFFACILLLFSQQIAMGQQSKKGLNIAGDYNLSGVMETASGIRLNADSSFQFFYSYGASDREGSGTWTLRENTLVLNSKPRPAKDFRLISSSHKTGNDFTISLSVPNSALYTFFKCQLKTADSQFIFKPDKDGLLIAPMGPYQEIGLVFSLCGDRPSYFNDLNKEHNYYQFEIEKWICEVFFDNITLIFKEQKLVGQHPLIPGNQFTYLKQD